METVTGFETPEEAALELELPLLGTLPPPDIKEGAGIAPAFPADERARREYHRAADRLLLSPHSRSGSIGLLGDVTPAHRALVASRLAASVAAERTAILVDADVRAAHLSFDERDRAQEGLVDVLRYGVRSPRVVAPTQTPGLNLLPVGSGTVDLEGTFGSDAVRALFEELGRTGDLLLINGPDLVDFRAAASFLAEVDAWILVHEIGASDSAKTRRLRDTFGREKCVGILAVTAPELPVAAEPTVEEAASGAADAAAIAGAAASTDSLEIVHGAGAGVPMELEPPVESTAPESVAPEPGPPAPVAPGPQSHLEMGAEPEAAAPQDTTQPTASEFETAEAEALAEALTAEPGQPAEYELLAEPTAVEPEPEPGSEPDFETEAVAEPEPEPDLGTEAGAEAEPAEMPDAVPAEIESPAQPASGSDLPGLLQEPEAPAPAVAVPEAESSAPSGTTPAPALPESPLEAAPVETVSDEFEHAVEASDDGGSRRPIWITLGVVVVVIAAFFAWRLFGNPFSGGGDAQPRVATSDTRGPGPAPGTPGDSPSAPPADTPASGGSGAADPAAPEGAAPLGSGSESPAGAPDQRSPDSSGDEATSTSTPPPPEATTPAQVESSAPAEPPVERSAPVGTTGPRYGVHVASVKAEAGARREAARYEKAGYPTVLRQKEIPGKGLWWRVYVGPYGAKGDASRTAGEIKKAGITDYTQVHRLPEE